MTTEPIRFHFDPLCPWCWMTSKWVRRLATLGRVTPSWGLFSLDLVNADRDVGEDKGHARGAPALRTAIAVRDAGGDPALGRFYEALGNRVHERGEAPDAPATITAAVREAGLDADLYDAALADDTTWKRVEAEHRALVERTRSFGVPTIVLDGGEGPAIFGPVISEVPGDDDAVALFDHVAWLVRQPWFSELKRDRDAMSSGSLRSHSGRS